MIVAYRLYCSQKKKKKKMEVAIKPLSKSSWHASVAPSKFNLQVKCCSDIAGIVYVFEHRNKFPGQDNILRRPAFSCLFSL